MFVRKVIAFCLIILAVCHIVGVWQVLTLHETYLANSLLNSAGATDVYSMVAYLLFVGFQTFWALLFIRKEIFLKTFCFLFSCNVVGCFWLFFMSTWGTVKGFDTAVWSTGIIFGINALFAFGYMIKRRTN